MFSIYTTVFKNFLTKKVYSTNLNPKLCALYVSMFLVLSPHQSYSFFDVKCTDFERNYLSEKGEIKIIKEEGGFGGQRLTKLSVDVITLPPEEIIPIIEKVEWYLESCKGLSYSSVPIEAHPRIAEANNRLKMNDKVKSLLDSIAAEKAAAIKEEGEKMQVLANLKAKAGDCKRNGYNTCYNGIKWGTPAEFHHNGNKLNEFFCSSPKTNQTTPHVKNIVRLCGPSLGDSKITDALNILGEDNCDYILVDNKIVGFKETLYNPDENAFTLKKAELRNKYGAPQESSLCNLDFKGNSAETLKYTSKTGLEVVLTRSQNSNNGFRSGKPIVVVRYLFMPSLKESSHKYLLAQESHAQNLAELSPKQESEKGPSDSSLIAEEFLVDKNYSKAIAVCEEATKARTDNECAEILTKTRPILAKINREAAKKKAQENENRRLILEQKRREIAEKKAKELELQRQREDAKDRKRASKECVRATLVEKYCSDVLNIGIQQNLIDRENRVGKDTGVVDNQTLYKAGIAKSYLEDRAASIARDLARKVDYNISSSECVLSLNHFGFPTNVTHKLTINIRAVCELAP
ncbi:hypothetical protein BDW_13900 [Bdellovibrio bacteriovorus W]|nr:hypothetical protein BDW_13900 [Bdellovibrio bacteriovorus W]